MGNDYYERWYAENGEAVNEKRRERYATDPKYREAVLKRNTKSRRKRRRKLIEEERAKLAAKKLRTDGSWKTHTVIEKIKGKKVEVTYFSIGALAKVLGKGISTVRVWEKNGVIDPTPHRSPKGDRLYTLEQVQTIRKRLRESGKIEPAMKLRKKGGVAAPVVKPVKFADGRVRDVPLYQVGSLAQVIDKTVVWVKALEKRGRLPKTPLIKSSIGHRLYTVEMIEVARKAFLKHKLHLRGNDQAWQALYDDILDGWDELGVADAHVVEVDDEDQSNQGRRNPARRRAPRNAVATERVA